MDRAGGSALLSEATTNSDRTDASTAATEKRGNGDAVDSDKADNHQTASIKEGGDGDTVDGDEADNHQTEAESPMEAALQTQKHQPPEPQAWRRLGRLASSEEGPSRGGALKTLFNTSFAAAAFNSVNINSNTFRTRNFGESMVLRPRRRTTDKKPCIRNRGEPKSKAQKQSELERRKTQRVRFYLADEHRGMFSIPVWDPKVSNVPRTWNSLLLLPMIYELWAAAFRLALGTPHTAWLRWLDLSSDICFVIDSAMEMNTAIRVRAELGSSGEDLVVTSRSKLVANYMRNFSKGFPVMIVPSIVYWVVTLLELGSPEPRGQGADNLWGWWVVSMLRGFFKIKRLYIYNKSIEMNLDVSVSSMQLVKFALMILLSAHWIGCFYFFVARVQPPLAPTWMDQVEPIFPAFQTGSGFDPTQALRQVTSCMP